VFPEIHWQFAPLTLNLEGRASLPLERGMISATGAEMRKFLQAAGNPPTGCEVAVIAPVDVRWFAIISREHDRPRPNAQREEWSEESREADGRDVVILTVLAPVGESLFRFEMLSEKAGAERARAEFDAVTSRLAEPHAEKKPRWWILPPGLGLLALSLYWIVRRRRQRGL